MAPPMQRAVRLVLAGAAFGLAGCGGQEPRSPGPAPYGPQAREGPPPARRAPELAFDAIVKQAQEARDAGRLAEAVTLYEAALGQKPGWAEGEWVLGLLLYQLKRYEEGRDAFQRVTRSAPDHARARAMKGLCEFQIGNHAEALLDLERADAQGLAGDPRTEGVTRYHRAILLTRMQEFEGAFGILKRLVPLTPDNPQLVEALGLNILRLAVLPPDIAADSRPVVRAAGEAGSLMLMQKRPQARKAFQEMVERFPDTPNVHYAFGAFLITEEPEPALEQFREELRVSPEHVAARLQIAREYLKRGDHAAALPFAREAAQKAPGSSVSRSTHGRALLAEGDAAGAVAELEAAVRLDPNDAQTHFALAKAYTGVGRKDDAARARAAFLKLTEQQEAGGR